MNFIDDSKIPDSPYPELRDILHALVDAVSAEVGDNLVGIYLVGSLASGDFDLDSDVDFLVVTKAALTEAEMKPLQEAQTRIHALDCYPAKHLEGSYIGLSDLNDWSSVGKKKLYYFDNGSTAYELSTHDNQWHVRWILREHGITMVGPEPITLLPPIPPYELAGEVRTVMLEILDLFREEIDRPLSFFNSRFGQSFTVLTCCRILHTLSTGTIQSKRVGVIWARQVLGPKWIHLIDQAWEERKGVRFGVKAGQRAQAALLSETLEFIQYAFAAGQDKPLIK